MRVDTVSIMDGNEFVVGDARCPCRIFGTYSGRCSCGPETATVPRVG
jgi:hypothetical protein